MSETKKTLPLKFKHRGMHKGGQPLTEAHRKLKEHSNVRIYDAEGNVKMVDPMTREVLREEKRKPEE